jgi:hypothetical protein
MSGGVSLLHITGPGDVHIRNASGSITCLLYDASNDAVAINLSTLFGWPLPVDGVTPVAALLGTGDAYRVREGETLVRTDCPGGGQLWVHGLTVGTLMMTTSLCGCGLGFGVG